MKRVLVATVLAGQLVALQAPGDVVFETIQSPAFVGRGPGPDGFVGTADDVADPTNTRGAVTYGIPTTGLRLYSEATTVINEPFVFVEGISTITDFTTSGSLRPGHSFSDNPDAFSPDPSGPLSPSVFLPHEMLTDLRGRTDGQYYLSVCSGGPPCVPPGDLTAYDAEPARFFNHSGRGQGYILRRGEDPYRLPGIDPALAGYLEQLTGVVPDDWTAIALKAGGRLDCADWDPEANGFLSVQEESLTALYAELQPTEQPVKVVRSSGPFGVQVEDAYVFENVDLIDELVDAPNSVFIRLRRLAIDPDGDGRFEASDQLVGEQGSQLRVDPDRVCVLQSPGSVLTEAGKADDLQYPETPDDCPPDDPSTPKNEHDCPTQRYAGIEPGAFLPAPFLRGTTIGGVASSVSTSPIEFVIEPVAIEIDIRPGNRVNPIHPSSRAIVSVAILGSNTLDVADIDPATLAFGPGRASPRHDLSEPATFGEHLEPLGGEAVAGWPTRLRVDFSGVTGQGGSVTGTLGAYDVEPDAGRIPVDAWAIEFTATGMSEGNGSFGGWGHMLGRAVLDFRFEPPLLLTADPDAFRLAFLEENELIWHLHPGVRPGPPSFLERSEFHRLTGLGLPRDQGTLVLSTTVIPRTEALLLAHFRADQAGIAAGAAEACVSGLTRDGIPFEGCDAVRLVPPARARPRPSDGRGAELRSDKRRLTPAR